MQTLIEPPKIVSHDIVIPAEDVPLNGELSVPQDPIGIVLFAHGSGSSRKSPRNQAVAHKLQNDGLATLLFDLLTEDEEQAEASTGELRFNISMLAERLLWATSWAQGHLELSELPTGYFGTSTGAGAALSAARKLGNRIRAVVSRGGRPDLAVADLPFVVSPTLLIVGGNDAPVIDMNRTAQASMNCENFLKILPGATHLFPEPGALEAVAELASRWFRTHFR